jgi:hypothetical protein
VWKWLPVKNTPAYYTIMLITAVKKFSGLRGERVFLVHTRDEEKGFNFKM